jgi:hypothetical protein
MRKKGIGDVISMSAGIRTCEAVGPGSGETAERRVLLFSPWRRTPPSSGEEETMGKI